MRKVLLLLIPFWLAPLLAQSTANEKVLQSVRQIIESEGTVIFSELYNDDRFNSDEKAFLGRLYEIFFQIPVFYKVGIRGHGGDPDPEPHRFRFWHQPSSRGFAADRDGVGFTNAHPF